jgi:hypothetical protein
MAYLDRPLSDLECELCISHMSETTDDIKYTGPGHMVVSPKQSWVYPTSRHKINVSRTNPVMFGLYE